MEQKEIEEYEEPEALERDIELGQEIEDQLTDDNFIELKDLWERSKKHRLKELRKLTEECGIPCLY